MKPIYCQFPISGMNDGMVAECWQDRVAFFALALLAPHRYRMGHANGTACIWWKRQSDPGTEP